MITQNLISKAQDFAKINGPQVGHLDIANEAGQKIAQNLSANKDIVLLGTLLMDCALGIAIKHGKLPEHIKMSHDAAKDFLDQDSDITSGEKLSVFNCILEHHNGKDFSSLESEIVCNADCYRFASIPGFYFALTHFDQNLTPNMPEFFKSKFIEKNNLITLDFVKQDLKEQINIINNFIQYL